MKEKSEKASTFTSRLLPSFCFGFIALVLNSNKSWSFSTRAKLAKLGRSLNRSSWKFSLIFLFMLRNCSHKNCILLHKLAALSGDITQG